MIAIAIDDEPPALSIIERFCAENEMIDLKKTFTNAAEAIKYLKRYPVDLMFIDIQMPGYNGVEMYKSLDCKPMVIFTTAFSEYAVEGFNNNDTVILGVSKDSIKKHNSFIEKYSLPFLLLSDEEGKVCEEYEVWQLKKMMGKEYMGIVRSTFLIDKTGEIIKEWRGVKVDGHTEEVLLALKELK
jgi:DNA-binding LytR/AlgR family response regulator